MVKWTRVLFSVIRSASTAVPTAPYGNAPPTSKEGEWRVSTKTDSLSLAKEFAEDWYPELRGKSCIGQLKTEKTCTQRD